MMLTYELTPENQKKFENELVGRRLLELLSNPMQRKFDLEHLKEINRYLFQDMPKLGPEWADIYKPGVLRSEVGHEKDWSKSRFIASLDEHSYVSYSHMDNNALKLLDDVLREADQVKLATLNQEDFTKKICDIYVKLDYIHPFYDGNSRTLRFFIQDLAREAGFELNWAKTNENQVSRDGLCIARDVGVYEIAKDKFHSKHNFKIVTFSCNKFSQYEKLEDILKTCITKIKTPKLTKSDSQNLSEVIADDIIADKILNEVLESERLQKALLATQEYKEALDNYIGAERTKINMKVMEIDRSIQRQEKSLKQLNEKQPRRLASRHQKEKYEQARNKIKGNIQKLKNDKSQIRRRLDEDVLLKEFRDDNPELSNSRDLEVKQEKIKKLQQAEQMRKLEREEKKQQQQDRGLSKKLSIKPDSYN